MHMNHCHCIEIDLNIIDAVSTQNFIKNCRDCLFLHRFPFARNWQFHALEKLLADCFDAELHAISNDWWNVFRMNHCVDLIDSLS